jgi:hypothetical protein
MVKSLRHDFTEVWLRVWREGETVVFGETESRVGVISTCTLLSSGTWSLVVRLKVTTFRRNLTASIIREGDTQSKQRGESSFSLEADGTRRWRKHISPKRRQISIGRRHRTLHSWEHSTKEYFADVYIQTSLGWGPRGRYSMQFMLIWKHCQCQDCTAYNDEMVRDRWI